VALLKKDFVMVLEKLQNRELRAIGRLLLLLSVGSCVGCGEMDTSTALDDGTECMTMVRATIENVDRAETDSIRVALIDEALLALGEAPSMSCERDLLLVKLDLLGDADLTEVSVRTGERLLAMRKALTPDQLARVKFQLAEIYFQLKEPRSFDMAKDVFLHWDSMGVRSQKMYDATSLLVKTYDLTGELKECEELLTRALVKAKGERDPLWTAELLDRLSVVVSRQTRMDEAIAIQQEGIALLDGLLKNGSVHDTLVQRSNIVQDDRNPSMTPDSSLRLLTIRDQLMLRYRLRTHMGEAFLSGGRRADAKRAYEEAALLANGPLVGLVDAPFNELGRIALLDGNAAEAIERGRAALTQGQRKHDPAAVHDGADILYLGYKAQGETGLALAMFELAKAYDDSLGNASFALDVQKKQVLYEVRDDSLRMVNALDQEQLERKSAQLEAKSNRTIALAVGVMGFVLLMGGGFWFATDRKRRKERFDRESAQLETQALRSQMNPHFIFNALNSINNYVQENDQDSASSYLVKFARVMRAVLENSRFGVVSLKDDLDTLQGYLELERMRMQQRFDFKVEVSPDLDPEEVMVPPLVVQPFVENAIWHGITLKEGKGHILLRVERRGKQLVWIIEDDGVGRSAPKPEIAPVGHRDHGAAGKKTSLGTSITRARLDLVQKQHGGKAGFRYIDLPQGTRVEVDLPLMEAG